jgi:outer membrane protein assembly factor BamB
MPVIATLGAASTRGFGGFYQTTSISNTGWMSRIGVFTDPMSSDSNNNIYAGDNNGLIIKIGPDGALVWQKNVLNQFGSNVSVERNQVSSLNLIGLVGDRGESVTAPPSIELLDSDGNIYYSAFVSGFSFFNSIASSETGSIFFSGSLSTGSGSYFKLSGTTIAAKKRYTNSNGVPRFVGGGSGDTAYMGDTFNGNITGLTKVDSNISLLWRSASSSLTRVSQAVESNGAVYAVGSTSAVVKLNATTGAFVWARTLSSSLFTCLAVDSANNIYAGGYDSTNDVGVLLKVSNSGNIIWQRSFFISTMGTAAVTSITVNNLNNSICVQLCSSAGFGSSSVLFSVPNNGSLTGTYTAGASTVTYANISKTFSSVTYTFTSTPISFASTTAAETNFAASVSNASATYTLTTIP